MSTRADLGLGRARGGQATTALILVLAVLASTMAISVVNAPPAQALHQHCGDDLAGTYSETNGHPLADAYNPGWSGNEILQDYAIALRAIEFTRTVLGDVADTLDAAADLVEAIRDAGVGQGLAAGTPASQIYAAVVYIPALIGETALRLAIQVILVADLILAVVETVLKAIEFKITLDVDDENACGGTLGGDTLTMTWVAMVQRNLAAAGPPLAIFMAPHDPDVGSTQPQWPILPRTVASDFSWCPDIPQALLREELPAPPGTTIPDTGGNCTSPVQLGLLDAPSLGVQAVVTNTITHLVSHGVDVRNAEDLLGQADEALEDHRYSDAYYLYRDAYQQAMAVTSS